MIREAVLDKALKIVTGARQSTYGNPEDCFKVIAELWSAYLGTQISSTDVAMLMILLKIARSKGKTGYADNYIDIAGYAACAGELADATECKRG